VDSRTAQRAHPRQTRSHRRRGTRFGEGTGNFG